MIEWFYDHSVGQTVKGMNILTAFYGVHWKVRLRNAWAFRSAAR